MNKKIRVGIIGLGGWAKYGHIPVGVTTGPSTLIVLNIAI